MVLPVISDISTLPAGPWLSSQVSCPLVTARSCLSALMQSFIPLITLTMMFCVAKGHTSNNISQNRRGYV